MTPAEHISAALCLLEHVKLLDVDASKRLSHALRDILDLFELKTTVVSITLPVLPLEITRRIWDEIASALDVLTPPAGVRVRITGMSDEHRAEVVARCDRFLADIETAGEAFEALSAVASGRAAN